MKNLNNLKGKRLLFISVSTFGYETAIKNEFEQRGLIVDFFDERPSDNFLVKGIIRIKKSLYSIQIKNYYKKILASTENENYDYLVIIKGESVPVFFIEDFKKKNPKTILIFYTWDSIRNNKNPLSFIHLFDKCLTFDSKDALDFGLIFRPLFYLNEYSKLRVIEKSETKYDIVFLGTAHSDRYHISNTISLQCKKYGFSSYTYYYIQSKLVYYYKKFFDKTFRFIEKSKLSFSILNFNQILNLYSESKIILDIQHPLQTGLTMRTFEALGAGKKLVTTNSNIKDYAFYNTNNISIINREQPLVNSKFFLSDFIPYSKEMNYAMSISGWVDSLFFLDFTNDFWLKK